MIEVKATIRRGNFTLDADFAAVGPVVSLFGRSGSGKTSIAQAVAGLVRPVEGRIRIEGETVFDSDQGMNLPAWKRRIGYVFQDPGLFPHLSVEDNLLYGARRRGLSVGARDEIIVRLDLAPLLARKPTGLSGGEARRVAIGRALLSGPRLLILDEPLAGLDGGRRSEILACLERVIGLGTPILHITHAVDEVARLADQVVLLADGRIEGSFAPTEAFARPEAERAAGLTAPLSILEGRAVQVPSAGVDLGGVHFHTPPLAVEAGTRVRIIIDARDVALALRDPEGVSFQNRLRVTVRDVQARPDGVLVHLDGPGILVALVTHEAARALDIQQGKSMVALVKATAAARYA